MNFKNYNVVYIFITLLCDWTKDIIQEIKMQ